MKILYGLIVLVSFIISIVICPAFTKGYSAMHKTDFILMCSLLTPFLGVPIFYATHQKR